MITSSDNTANRDLHICLTGGWFSSDNIGDHAILCGITDAFRKLGTPRFSVITANPTKVRQRYGFDAYAPKQTPWKLLHNLLSADLFVYTGGTPFYEAKPHMTYYSSLAQLANMRRIPVLVFGVSMRSLTSRYCRFMMQQISQTAAVLGAREDRTLNQFVSWAGSRKTALFVPDAATQMTPATPARAASLIREAGGDPMAKNVAVCMRDFRTTHDFQKHHYSRCYDTPTLNRYKDSIGRLAAHVVRNHDANVLLCPMHTNPPDDDRIVMQQMVESIADPGIRRRCTLLDRQHLPRDMKAILGLMYAVVGVRFHSLVLATSMNVPALGIAYAMKNHAILKQMGQGEFAVDLAQLKPDTCVGMFNELVRRHDEIKQTLFQTNSEMHVLFAQRIQLLSELVHHRRNVNA
jgi:polysaccharide pyruvyl transferase WcaK-like protein